MEIVGRGIVAAGLGVYTAIHLAQAVAGPDSSPGWLTLMFVLTAVVAAGLGAAVFASSRWRASVVAASVIAILSMIALVLSYTTGFLGVTESDLTSSTLIVLVAEVMILLGTVAALFGDRFDFDEEAAIRESAVG